MFKISKKKESNSFDDKSYTMKEKYDTKNLCVANLIRVSSNITDFGPMIETTEQKYIFEKIVINGVTKYREIFTGFLTTDNDESINDHCVFKCFNFPYICKPLPFTDYFPETKGIAIPKLSLVWALNDINYSIKKNNAQELKKTNKETLL